MYAKRVLRFATGLLAIPGIAQAAIITMTFTPTPADLNDLEHQQVYKWGINVQLPTGATVDQATLTFYNIRNWDNQANVLYVHLLDWASLGVTTLTDNEGGGDYFAGRQGTHHLVTYTNLPMTGQTLVYNFSAANLVALNAYLADKRIGIGLDPDCHYYNDGVELRLVTPEPATLALLGAFVPLLGLRRRPLR